MYITPDKEPIEIMGTTISIYIDDDKLEEYDADGLYHDYNIYLKSEYNTLDDYMVAYRHECFHALCEILGIQLDEKAEEVLAHRVSIMMTIEI